MGNSSTVSIGRAGEFFAAYKLQMAGLEVSHVNGSCDLHVTLPSRLLLRLEVMTTLRPESFTQQAEDDDIARLMSLK